MGKSSREWRVLLFNAMKDSHVLLEPTDVGQLHKMVLLFKVLRGGEAFDIMPEEEPPEEFAALAYAYSDRLRALLDRAILAVHWDEGDCEAVIQIIPVGNSNPNEQFEEFTLPFPSAT
jgi:hypothetical protein